MTTLMVTWDQDFEIETVGAHMMKAMIFYKYLLKEEMCAVGKLKVSAFGNTTYLYIYSYGVFNFMTSFVHIHIFCYMYSTQQKFSM